MKKLFAILLAVAIMATMSVTAFAAESQTSTITVVMKDSGGDGWGEGSFGFVSLSTDELELEVGSRLILPKGVTNAFILDDGTTATVTHTVAKDEVVYFRWIDPVDASDKEASFNIYRDGILQYSCDDVTKFDGSGSVYELFFTSYPQRGMNVTYTVNPTYTVTIPENVTIGTDGTEKTVSAEGVVVEKGKYVSVALAADNTFTVKTTEGAELPYTVTANGETLAAGGEVLAVNPKDGKTGTATITFDIDETKIQYAGTYTGTAIFTIAVKDAPKTIINFTIDDVPYQAEEGMTWAEWIDSASNTIGLYLSDSADGVYWGEYYGYCLIDATDAVKASDVIEAEAYTLIQTEC